MGRKPGGLYINPKKFGSLHKPCMKEMIAFLNCLALCNNNDEKCVRQKELLNACMDAQVNLESSFLPCRFRSIFLVCHHVNDEACMHHRCILQAGKNKKPWGSINYHLQRLNRGRR